MDRRRGARVPTRLWVKIAGVDLDWVLRRGNVSMTGIYIELGEAVGEPGSVQTLSVSPYDREVETTLLARVARVVGIQDLWKGPSIAGIAFEFLPENPDKREQVDEVVHRIIAANAYTAESLQIDAHFQTEAAREVSPPSTAVVRDLGITGMVLMTSWPVAVGESIRCEIEAPESRRRIAVQGQVTHAVPDHDGFRVEVQFGGESGPAATTPAAEGTTISGAIDSLLEEILFPEADEHAPRTREHLRGSLARIHLASLLAFFELERMSGALKIRRNGSAAEIYLRQGQVVDAALDQTTDDPRGILKTLVSWESGEFEFEMQDVDRPDRVSTSTSALLLDLAKEEDERGG